MYRRLIPLALIIALTAPAAAMADASAAGLGPASATDSSGSSSADAGALQPAGTSVLQSNSGASGLSAGSDAASSLQQPATSDNSQLQVLLGNDADGTSHSASSSHSAWWFAGWIILALAVIGTGVYLLLRRRPRLLPTGSDIDMAEIVDADTPVATDDELPPESESAPVTEVPLTDDAAVLAEPTSDASTAAEPDETVQSDKMVPPIVSTTDKKTGDEGGKPAKHGHKKHHKKRSRR
ncbi:hypothetical protein HJC99_05890 [Candidatus Saccharibacteria bacterium]|nr:hypothetical protein [Candidatus Saccharibacteria bacterium]